MNHDKQVRTMLMAVYHGDEAAVERAMSIQPTEEDYQFGYEILRDICGGAEPTVENIIYAYHLDIQKRRKAFRLVQDEEE